MDWKITLVAAVWLALLVAVVAAWTTAPNGLHIVWLALTAYIVRWFVVTNPGGDAA